ncbi:4Fe-4S dicluster domain-containing protein [Robertmurraya andreesenii]|uniref:Fe-S-cluster-containing dehydrogenase component n=1 Tax=Anoxybacillus andreesenii TaxID=1325932 RepID=A0ABT9V805_9BACL|nr:4Fe-4S dicluster domain-containing protein [Robertmurraya andreesenii]MDQ0157078.1 Fe-S-cluster-containing dehydrogenase component [Robertmurraya andreesenii]
MSSQLMFSINLSKCINCKTCEMSCNDYHGLSGIHRRNVVTYENDSLIPVHLSISCNHCLNPVCVSICPENNFLKRSDGVVIHNPSNCRACRRCVTACPFHAPKINPKTNRVDKCNLCIERLDEGLKPVCVENCVTNALGIIEVNRKERKSYDFGEVDVPIASYTNPSIFVIDKQIGLTFFREEEA